MPSKIGFVLAIFEVLWISTNSLVSENNLTWHLSWLWRGWWFRLEWPICFAIPDSVILCIACKFGESAQNPHWLSVLTSSFSNNYVINEHYDWRQYDPYVIPSDIMLYYSNTASWVNQNHYWAMVLTSSSATSCVPVWPICPICNITGENAMLQLPCKFDKSKRNLHWTTVLRSSSGGNFVLTSLTIFTNMAHMQCHSS